MAFKHMKKYFGVFVIFLLITSTGFAQTDSLGIEKKGDQVFVVHKVLTKQTLFSLAKRYQTTVTEINQANPELSNGLQVGQTLKIPFGGTLPTEKKELKLTVTNTATHQVAPGETLFAIAKQYNVSITDLKTWNNLSSNSLSLGQELLVKVQSEVDATPDNETAKVVVPVTVNTASDTEPIPVVVVDTTKTETVATPEPEDYGGTKLQPFKVEGLAEVIDEEEPTTKFFALHRTAKVGTVIKVKNLMNDLTVYVRVVGAMPSVTDEKVIIKLNQKAYDHLKAIDKRFRVELSYFQ
ncbi:LysM peptidoglycan-binding domain-containing protein [Roseivirga sp. E12]|uniref:LysM peptidoglycan-binding domain-containing protein n=1 Tax=Roseivirga sp. E12 TaxID=2819237 RepID=UPI001ABD0A04|nr:LysM peptidoglycan-binding domain-containing protein [Roseivirga sp. E12]MBO3699996.1 LysM peptidoglycan-binding domain-containing protein [Roseivirga sp. E12]